MTLPNFLVIGVPKAGTTALYQYLLQHPAVFISENKEPHFLIAQNMAWDYHYLSAGYYSQQLKRYYDTFEPQQIQVLLQEDLKTNATETMQSLFQFLEIDDQVSLNFNTAHNVTQQPKNKAVKQFLSRQSGFKSLLKSPASLPATAPGKSTETAKFGKADPA